MIRDPSVIDAHHHLWDPATADYPWMTDDLAAIRRRFDTDDLAPLLAAAGVDATVLIQTRSSVAETEEFLAVADTSPFVAGVAGWLDLTDAGISDAIARLRSLTGGERLVGIRHQVHDEPDPDWLRRPDVRRGVTAVGAAGLVYDLLVRTRELPAALDLARDLAAVPFVIDHLAKPPIRDGTLGPWADAVAPFGELPNVSAKVSGLLTEADWARWTVDDLVPPIRHALDVFGPERLLFGSDWPVSLLAAPYERVVAATIEALDRAGLAASDRAAVMGLNAARVYRLA